MKFKKDDKSYARKGSYKRLSDQKKEKFDRWYGWGYFNPFANRYYYEEKHSIVNGSENGTDKDGVKYSVELTDLRYESDCKYCIAVSGKREETEGDKKTVTDYGKGECDNKISVTKDGKTEEKEVNNRYFYCEYDRWKR